MVPSLEIRVLGELEVLRDGKPLTLPASKKTRALFGFLIVAGCRPQSRQRLCELLWDGPDDPRAALRWSLSKLRPLVDEANVSRLLADREHVAFESRGAAVDWAVVDREPGWVETATTETLQTIATLYRGELLEGLDLSACYRYQEWCTAEREAARRGRVAVLGALVQRFDGAPEEALRYARARVAIDPLTEEAHLAVMQRLVELGRCREALKQYEACRRIFEDQFGRKPSSAIEAARAAIGTVTTSGVSLVKKSEVLPAARTALVARGAERAMIADALSKAAAGVSRGVLLFSGEPGIGKTRLLRELMDQALALGGAALFGRAFEAEMIRPYGAWIDILRCAPSSAIDATLRPDLSQLLPELDAPLHDTDRTRLFDAVAKVLFHCANGGPVAVALDDVQWLDEASAALLSYVSRTLAGSRVLFACAARPSGLDANPPAQAVFRALARDGRLARVDVGPLDRQATDELVRSVDGRVDATQVFTEGGGNPLFSLELARALAQHGQTHATTRTLDDLIAERLSQLDDRAAELLPWAAALGRAFSIDTLAALTSLTPRELISAVEGLERHGVLRVTSSASGTVGYDFAHDLVRRCAYRGISEPRRLWMHLHIARTLQASQDPDGALAADVAHHAALAGDSELAARGYLLAGERALRLFAYADADRLASAGIQHVDHVADEVRLRLRLALLSVQVHSNQWLRRANELEGELSRVATVAQQRGMHAEAARAYYLMSFVHNETGDHTRASARTLEAAKAGRSADEQTRHEQLANSGRCLALIERDLAHADELLREAQRLGTKSTRASLELSFGLGLIHAFKGLDDEAVPLLERAADLAEIEGDHWTRSQALTRIARLELERGRLRRARERCAALAPLVAKLSEGSEAPFVGCLSALIALALGETDADVEVERSLERLRIIDSQAYVAYGLNTVAGHDARGGRRDVARLKAEEAVRCADRVGQKSEMAVGRSILSLLALDRGHPAEARALLETYGPDLSTQLALSARARAAVTSVARRLAGEPLLPIRAKNKAMRSDGR